MRDRKDDLKKDLAFERENKTYGVAIDFDGDSCVAGSESIKRIKERKTSTQ